MTKISFFPRILGAFPGSFLGPLTKDRCLGERWLPVQWREIEKVIKRPVGALGGRKAAVKQRPLEGKRIRWIKWWKGKDTGFLS
ncbi:hypothetical protein MPNT_210042 [Candidatus Methylacidithermus pantelleriae]|uniref:Uncharacterized protein n=1 Tax=Candidatus Methylacidithermus pantelleriae TaxID=2744239 RepID=A0A8J2BIC8_9BACT|nr:hypothetical protein MPNT_210042 [Candidatus Methylacidithermus pantelleriae]